MLLDKKNKFDLRKLKEQLRNKNVCKNFFMFVMGLVISGIAVSLLYEPYDIVTSGSTGIARIINKYLEIDLSLMIFVVCSFLLVISFCVFGVEYGTKNILVTILSPVFVNEFLRFFLYY